jgi:hypothetical protein
MYNKKIRGYIPIKTKNFRPQGTPLLHKLDRRLGSLQCRGFCYTHGQGYPVYGFQFGNELVGPQGIESHLTVEQYVKDFCVLYKLVGSIWGTSTRPKLLTPDTSFDQEWYGAFVKQITAQGCPPDAVTWHQVCVCCAVASGVCVCVWAVPWHQVCIYVCVLCRGISCVCVLCRGISCVCVCACAVPWHQVKAADAA